MFYSPVKKKRANKDTKTVIVSKPKLWKSQVVQEIKRLRRTTHFLIPKLVFARVVRDIIHDLFPRTTITRIQATAFEALQEATEMYLVQFFEDSILLASHAKRITLMRNDMILMRRLRGRDDIINR
ncbi:PREDICTED: histone H3.3-like isoform X2 [Trachymyrmex cornetzi]|uniref:histone H3.3-like isoform X2 n=1 Tax=Trachymyrmex cornetzi TaxID=471704 RepID=UPI00084F0255|nr:PREDICTED: histone H3.3-like isoform X2 [Trachymyrmex cornetzi]